MATDSSILAWKIPWTKEPGGLCPRGRKESDTTERLTLLLFIEDVIFYSFPANCSWFPYPIPCIKIIRPKN